MSEHTMDTLLSVGIALGILLAGYIVIRLIGSIVRKGLEKSKLDEALHSFIINCLRVILWIIVIITALDYIGAPISAFLTALGAAGVAVALALKDSLGNFAGGILIILSKPFKKGDYIEDYQTAGQVDKIDLLYTTLVTFDNKVITVPNGKLSNSTIINYTRMDSRRVDCQFSISYQDDIGKAKDVLMAVVESNPVIYTDPAPIIGVSSQNDWSITVDLKVWCGTQDYWDVKYYLIEQAKHAFDESDITIPFPQMEVRLKKR